MWHTSIPVMQRDICLLDSRIGRPTASNGHCGMARDRAVYTAYTSLFPYVPTTMLDIYSVRCRSRDPDSSILTPSKSSESRLIDGFLNLRRP